MILKLNKKSNKINNIELQRQLQQKYYVQTIIDNHNKIYLENLAKQLESDAYDKFLECRKNNIDYIFILWVGNNQITLNRLKSIKNLVETTDATIILITNNNLDKFILQEHPIIEEYRYLSDTHKSDYLRCYLMNFYGGGYSDIKKTTESWKNSFDKWEDKDKSLYSWIGNGCFICKENTPLTNEWYAGLLENLNLESKKLKKYPASHTRDSYETSNGKYPIKWATYNIIFNKTTDKYNQKLIRTLPMCICSDYK